MVLTEEGCRNSTSKWRAQKKPDLILEVWEALDCESVGTPEIEQIQEALREKFGAGGVESPASIARLVADEGAVLRLPEVFACDFAWRERILREQDPDGLSFSDFSEALESFRRLEERWREIPDDDSRGLAQLRAVASGARQVLLQTAASRIMDQTARRQAKEIAEWLAVWLQSPQLFPDWLELRLRSDDFNQKFPSLRG